MILLLVSSSSWYLFVSNFIINTYGLMTESQADGRVDLMCLFYFRKVLSEKDVFLFYVFPR